MTAEEIKLEERKIKALEKIANSLDALTIWFEEIDKDDWSERIQYYLAEWKKVAVKDEVQVSELEATDIDLKKPVTKRKK